MRISRKVVPFVAAALIAGQVGVAAAADVCLSNGGILPTLYVFKKVKAPKKPAAVASLTGYVVNVFGSYSVSGTAIAYADGTIGIGVTAHALENGVSNFSASWIATDTTLAGNGVAVDTDGDFQRDDETYNLTAVDCATALAPM